MSGALRLEVGELPLEREQVELLVAPLFEGERPLRGSAGRADWRLCGRLSQLLASGQLSGAPGEAALVGGFAGIASPWLLALGCGSGARFDAAASSRFAAEALARVLSLRVRSAVLALETRGPELSVRERVEGVVAVAGGAMADRTGARAVELSLRLVLPGEDPGEVLDALRDLGAAHPSGAVLLPPPVPAGRHQSPPRRGGPPPPPRGPSPVK